MASENSDTYINGSGTGQSNGKGAYDLKSLRNGSAVAVQHDKQDYSSITVRTPGSDIFTVSRTIEPHQLYTIFDKNDKSHSLGGTEYLVAEDVVAEYANAKQFREKLMFPCVTRFGHPFLWTILCADASGNRSESAKSQEKWAWLGRQLTEDGRPSWHIIEYSRKDGIYLHTQKHLKVTPIWPDGLDTIEDWLQLAYPPTRFLQYPLDEKGKQLLHVLLALDDVE